MNNFLNRCKEIHNDKYDYSDVEYTNSKTKVNIKCKTHGIFSQTPDSHLSGKGCPICNPFKRITCEEFIEKSKIVHGDRYDYSNTLYINITTKVKILCKTHGEFTQTPRKHLKGNNCILCSNKVKTTSDFIEKSILIHKNIYDYSDVEYINSKTKVNIKCKTHGIFYQKPNAHLSGNGCPKCKTSKMELRVLEYLDNNLIEYNYQKKFDYCKNINNLVFDFYLPYYNICIECNGIQHYNEIKFFGGKEKYKKTINNDILKSTFCKSNNISLYIIRYDDDIINKLNKIIKISKIFKNYGC